MPLDKLLDKFKEFYGLKNSYMLLTILPLKTSKTKCINYNALTMEVYETSDS